MVAGFAEIECAVCGCPETILRVYPLGPTIHECRSCETEAEMAHDPDIRREPNRDAHYRIACTCGYVGGRAVTFTAALYGFARHAATVAADDPEPASS